MKKIFLALAVLAALAINSFGLSITNLAATNVTTTSAYFRAVFDAAASNAVLYYGLSDATNNAALWTSSNAIPGNIAAGTTNATNVAGLAALHKYYWRFSAMTNGTSYWSAATSNFWTLPTGPTSTPTPATISVQTDTNGILKAPTNFFDANTNYLYPILGAYFVTNLSYGTTPTQAYRGDWGLAVSNRADLGITNVTLAEADSNAFWWTSKTLNLAVRTNYVQTNGSAPMAYLDITSPSGTSAVPAAGNLRLSAQTVNGQEAFYWTQSDGGRYRIGRDLIHTVIADEGLTNGQVVYWTTNMTSTAHHAKKALALDASTMPCQGVVVGGDATNGGSCTIMWQGRTPTNYLDAALAALLPGTPLYVSPTDAGKLTQVAPASPYFQQLVGYVNYNGAMDVRLGPAHVPEASTVFRTYQLWSASNSVVTNIARAMRTLDYGNTGVGVWTNSITSNGQYTAYCSGPGGAGLTLLKAGLYQVTATMKRSATGGDALSISVEIYIRATNGVETEVTPVGGTSAQALDGNYLEYIFSLNITNDTVMNASDSIMLKFKSSAIGGAPVDLYIGAGYLNIPVPSGQFTLQSDFAAHTNDTANTNINHLTWDQKLALTNAIGSSVQLGMGAYAYSGVAIGYGAYANSFGVAIGQNATSAWAGVAYGILATASSSNAVAIGPYSWATNDSVSIGYQVTNIIADTTRLKGDLDMNWRDVTNGRALYMTNGIFTESVTVGGTNVIDAVANLNSATNTLNTALGDVQLIKYPLTNNTATTAGKAYQLSNSTWVAANCTTQQTCSKLIGLAAGDSSVTNGIQVFGPITVTNEDLVPGDPVFVSATAGEWTQTAPTNSTYVLRCLGHAFDTNKIFIKPDGIWVTIE